MEYDDRHEESTPWIFALILVILLFGGGAGAFFLIHARLVREEEEAAALVVERATASLRAQRALEDALEKAKSLKEAEPAPPPK